MYVPCGSELVSSVLELGSGKTSSFQQISGSVSTSLMRCERTSTSNIEKGEFFDVLFTTPMTIRASSFGMIAVE